MLYRSTLIFTFLLSLSASTLHAQGEWPQFRGPTGQGLSTATGVPVEWSATKNIAWKTEIPGAGWSSPVVSDAKVYLTSAVGPRGGSITLHVYCVDAKS